jgi:hypothetical protein
MKTISDEEADRLEADNLRPPTKAPLAPTLGPPAPAGAAVKTVEAWGLAKGLLPQFFGAPTYPLPGGPGGLAASVPVAMGGMVGPRDNPRYGMFAAARVVNHWPEGKELTEEEFDAAIKAAGEHVAR